MHLPPAFARQFRLRPSFLASFISIIVALHGVFLIATTLLDQLAVRRATHVNDFAVDLPLLIGISLVYLSSLLQRRKRTAWLVAVGAYSLLMVLNVADLITDSGLHALVTVTIVRSVVLPILILSLLFAFQKDFIVRSDAQGFRNSVRFSILILLVAGLYGVSGFLLLDDRDFHREISVPTAIHYTVDQFDLTTNKPIHPYTRRAHLFLDSLPILSIGAVTYSVIAFFQPLRLRFSDQGRNRERMHELLQRYNAPSEDYFKLWPHDKQYFFDSQGEAAIAFHVYHGVALCVADPIGSKPAIKRLLQEFRELCYGNDWLPAMIHVADNNRGLYEKQGFTLQKIGEDAVIDIAHFQSEVAGNKYFRQIRNKFTKQGYTFAMLEPPHHAALIDRLRTISDEWLSQGGRTERGFVMGYFSPEYMQQCRLMVVRDAAGTIQAYLNQLPADFDHAEATYDMLRQSKNSLGNSNDFLLLNFIGLLAEQGYTRLSLGLAPLVGMDDDTGKERTLIDNVLGFASVNGDRLYSFSGLHRFKSKYEPVWSDRYIAYQNGVRGFSRTMNALLRTMRVKTKS